MAVCLLIDVPGGELEQYDEVMRKLEESGGKLGEGQTFHAAGKTDNGFMVIDVWNSREDSRPLPSGAPWSSAPGSWPAAAAGQGGSDPQPNHRLIPAAGSH